MRFLPAIRNTLGIALVIAAVGGVLAVAWASDHQDTPEQLHARGVVRSLHRRG